MGNVHKAKSRPRVKPTPAAAGEIELAGFDLDGLNSFFDAPPEAARDVEIGLEADRVHKRTGTRTCFNALHVANLAKTLTELPAEGESWHIVCKGNWPAWALVPRTLQLIEPRKIAWIGIATLGFSKDNVDELAQMLDAGTIAACDLLFSCYFRSMEAELVGYLGAEMTKRGQRTCAIRTHAKVIAMELTDGTGITIESSANLRSCRNVEQFTITNDAHLLDFHRDWLTTLVAGGNAK